MEITFKSKEKNYILTKKSAIRKTIEKHNSIISCWHKKTKTMTTSMGVWEALPPRTEAIISQTKPKRPIISQLNYK